ncbi:ParB/RepB/Spo0J family partition protein [Streptomyces sp.]|uniref:ParB/RepB/Spo0J family partition protein n=1 Tax=Streptomyces sp. TaxID=1931 RepID=UPI002F91FED4
MSKADLLGAGKSFQRAQPVSARRAAINAATAAPTDGTQLPTELELSAISLNPANPRSELGDLTDLANSLRDHGQKTAISIMSRFAYLESNPDREAELDPGAKYVVIDGNSRLAAAREAGLRTIKVMVDDTLGRDPNGILESALVANIHRSDLEPLDEARALQTLLEVHGTQEALAARLHRSQGWVSQRLALLNLTPELQRRLENGEEQARLLRRVGNKKPDEQEALLAELKAKEQASKGPGRSTKAPAGESRRASTKPEADVHYPVMNGGPANSAAERPQPVPEPRPHQDTPPAAAVAPAGERPLAPAARTAGAQAESDAWASGAAAMDRALRSLDDIQRSRFIVRYVRSVGTVEEFATDMARSVPPGDRAEVAAMLRGVADLLAGDAS